MNEALAALTKIKLILVKSEEPAREVLPCLAFIDVLITKTKDQIDGEKNKEENESLNSQEGDPED